ncbi:MAG TPA: TraR/DksA family transcriptional regulator [Candidatus Binataceae bacterium]|nr:TraR/DksA family transcriptional regulator [Candidatus Binataceae bacterium]
MKAKTATASRPAQRGSVAKGRTRELEAILRDARDEAVARIRTFRGDQSADVDSSPGDEMDVARSLSEVETHASLIEIAQQRLAAIDEALVRVHNGTYGVCENCGEQIPVERLRALPFARLCIDCQREAARGVVSGNDTSLNRSMRKRWTPPEEMRETEDHDEEVTAVADDDINVTDDSPFGPDETELELAPSATRRRGRPRKRASKG